ncbi:MAG: hypothetical protein Q9191_006529, partial [Dirinaria sp. TL-2023a]
MTTKAKDRDREMAQSGVIDISIADADMDVDDDVGMDDGMGSGQEALGSKVIVIHPGSQNLRIGLANDPLPKTIPMVIARKWPTSESEEHDGEPKPKRLKKDDGSTLAPDKMFGEDVRVSEVFISECLLIEMQFGQQYTKMSADLKIHMRTTKRKVLPNSKELVVNYNKRTPPEKISEHNDPFRIDWTELPLDPEKAPDYITGKEALRIPDHSNPRYKLFWPLQQGWYNEKEYDQKRTLFDDVSVILEEAIKYHLNLRRKKDWAQYSCVYIIPDLYEKQYVVQTLEMLMRDFGFGRACFIQESLSATFGSGVTQACVVDVGAQKTSICCVEEGMCIENSRINLKYGGADVTETFTKMMLFDHFPYQEINLNRRYDFLLAEEIKTNFCHLEEDTVVVYLYDFHLRAPGQETRKYSFKTYDEPFLAVQGFFYPSIFDNAPKLKGRRKIVPPSVDLYDGSSNDPVSSAQSAVVARISPPVAPPPEANGEASLTPARQPSGIPPRLNEPPDRSSPVADSPAGDDDATPAPAADGNASSTPNVLASSIRDDVLPAIGLDEAVMTSIAHGSRGDERKIRDFIGGIMLIGGCSLIKGLDGYLEERLRLSRPGYTKEIM